MSFDAPIDAPEPPHQTTPSAREGRRRLALAVTPIFLLCVLVGLIFGTWWIGTPPAPSLDDLVDQPSDQTPDQMPLAPDPSLDPEQRAFLEDATDDARDIAVDERLEHAAGARERRQALQPQDTDFTDFEAVRYLAGPWRFALGRGRHVQLRFDAAPAGTVPRDSYRVTLFRVDGARWPYYTVVSLSDGRRLLAFLDADGRFRDLLEDVEVQPPTHLAYSLPGSGRRLAGIRLRH